MSDTPRPTNKTGGLARVNAGETANCTVDEVAAGVAAFGRKHPEIVRLEVFGSVARGEAHAKSDVDLVATFAPTLKETVRGWDFFPYLDDLEHDLATALNRRVHIVDHDGVESSARSGNKSLARAIARDRQIVYEANDQTKGCPRPHR